MNYLDKIDSAPVAGFKYPATDLPVIRKPEWHFQADNFSLQYEVINGNVLHGISTGRLKADHIEPAFKLKENVISSMGLDSGAYNFVLGLTGSKGTGQKARKLYRNAILRLYKKYPFHMVIFYGANRLLTAGINLAKPFVPFKVRVTNDFDKALKLIAEEKPKDIISSNLIPIKNSAEKPGESNQIQDYFQTDPDMMTTMFFDITARKQAENALRQSEERYKTLTNNLHVGIYRNTTGSQGKFIEANPAIVEMFGYQSRDEFMAVNVADLYQNPDDRNKFNAKILKNGSVNNYEANLKKKDGTPFVGSISAVAVKDANGAVKNYDGIIEDITGKKELELQLQQAQKMEAIGTLAGGIAHDFNNILSAILGYTELALSDAAKASTLYQNLQEVFRAGERAKDLVKQILTFSRQAEQERKPVQVKLIGKEAIKFLRASLPTTIEIRQEVKSDSLVMADPTQIHQLLMNLCTNAGHAMGEKGGVLAVKLIDVKFEEIAAAEHSELKPGPYLELTISDTGHGIPAHILDRIFDPFFTTKEKGEGTGMGLSVVHGIVGSYGGKIIASSEPGKGSTFRVYLPTVERDTAPLPAAGESIATGTERILFVDDETALATIGKQMLESLGYKVTTRTSSIEALELFKAKAESFDLVITDMTMPNMTGDELARELIRIKPEIPVILCTGYSARINQQQAAAMGIRAFVSKPVLRRDLAETIRNVLDEK